MGDQLRTSDWTTVCKQKLCLHTAVSSQRLFRSVAGHSVYLSTNFLFTCQSFYFSSVLFNKHSSNELNGRLTNQYWSQRCSTQVVKGQNATKIQNEKNLSPTGFLFFFFYFYFFFDCDKSIIHFFS